MSSPLKDKVAIITGANSGIGLAVATMMAQRGASITMCGRDEAKLQSALDTVVAASGGHRERFLTVAGDVTKHDHRKEIVDKTVEKFGRLDILVSNAGVLMMQDSLREATEEMFDTVINTNIKAGFFLIQQALPHLEKSKGNIVITSSIVSTIVSRIPLLYSMSKAAIDHLTRCLALDLGAQGIRVNAVNPAYIQHTDLARDSGLSEDEIYAIHVPHQPLENRCGTAEDVAEAVTFLASDAASFITGETLGIDGGRRFMGPFL